SYLYPPQARPGADRLPAPGVRAGAARDLRRDGLSGRCDGSGAGGGRVLARRGGRAAIRHRQEDQRQTAAATREVHRRVCGAGGGGARRRADLRAVRTVRPLWLQPRPRGLLRVDPRAVNRRVLESLIKAGALDSLGMPRAQLLQLLDEAMEAAQRVQRARASGQTGLFDLSGETAPAEAAAPAGPVEEFSREEL